MMKNDFKTAIIPLFAVIIGGLITGMTQFYVVNQQAEIAKENRADELKRDKILELWKDISNIYDFFPYIKTNYEYIGDKPTEGVRALFSMVFLLNEREFENYFSELRKIYKLVVKYKPFISNKAYYKLQDLERIILKNAYGHENFTIFEINLIRSHFTIFLKENYEDIDIKNFPFESIFTEVLDGKYVKSLMDFSRTIKEEDIIEIEKINFKNFELREEYSNIIKGELGLD